MREWIFLLILIITVELNALNVNTTVKWKLLGATSDINVTSFSSDCTKAIWSYDSNSTESNVWKLYVPDGKDYGYPVIDKITYGDGFWYIGNSTCDHNFTKDNNYTQEVDLVSGWQLVGSNHIIGDNNDFNQTCVDVVWGFIDNSWKYYSNKYISSNNEQLNGLNEADGFWIYANSACKIFLSTDDINSTYNKVISFTVTDEGLSKTYEVQDNLAAKQTKLDWNTSNEYCNTLNLNGYSDWRLPNIAELDDISKKLNYFTNNRNDLFWSSTNHTDLAQGRYMSGLGTNTEGEAYKDSKNFVRCVRGDELSANVMSVYDRNDLKFIDNAMIQDNSYASSNELNWTKADEYCGTLNLAGYSDWRLPNVLEYGRINRWRNDVNNSFNYNKYSWYWTNEDNTSNENEAKYFSYNSEKDFAANKSDKKYVRCMRGDLNTTIPVEINTTVASADITLVGSLMVQDDSSQDGGVYKKQADAITYCDGLSLGGYDDWRLPTKDELSTVYTSVSDLTFVKSAAYWSSTPHETKSTYGYYVNLGNGFVGSYTKTTSYYVRCVR